MTNDFEALKQEIARWYPDQDFTDIELDDMAKRLIKFCTIGAKLTFEAKRTLKDSDSDEE